MHSHALAVVSIPPVEEDPEATAHIESCIEELERRGKESSEMAGVACDIITARLRSRLSAFSREVFSAVDDLLYPYGIEATECYEFVDRTGEIQESYAKERMDCIRLPGGRIVSEFNSLLHSRFTIRDGRVFERNAGQLKQLKRTHIAKKMKALPNYPMSKLYRTIGEFASRFHGCEYDEDHKAYGYYCNPNAMWDWYRIGGRWPITFLVKDSCTEFCIGERCWGDEDTVYPAPQGFRWVSAARKKDIEWEAMKEWKIQQIRPRFFDFVEMYIDGTKSAPYYFAEKDGCVYAYGAMIYRIGESVEEFCDRIRADDTRRFPVAFCDLVSEFDWIAEGEAYIRPGETEPTAADWGETIQQYIADLDDEAVLVSVDYHI